VTWKSWGGGLDFCEHGHTREGAEACARATGRAMIVDMRTMDAGADGLRFTALNVEPYTSGGETVDLSAFFAKGKP